MNETKPAPPHARSRAAAIVGASIQAHRRQAGLSLDDLAHLVGSSKQVISRYELGHAEPSFQMVIAIAEACDTTPSTILSVLDDEGRSLDEQLHGRGRRPA